MEIYADGYQVSINKLTATVDFSVSIPQNGNQIVARVRMPPLMAKMMCMSLRKLLKEFESKEEVLIPINREILNQQGIAPEDW